MIAMFFTDPVIYREKGVIVEQQLEYAALTARRLVPGRMRDSRVLRVSSSCRRATFGNGWLAVGDSAFALDPISGRGVFNALRWASPAAESIAGWLGGDDQTLRTLSGRMRLQYEEYVRQRRIYYASEQRWTDRRFWRERQGGQLAASAGQRK
jgi:flavin-dependent dehydrogenase